MIINKIINFLWGKLEKEELKKFTLLSLGFFLLIGSFWPLKVLKESIFINIVGPEYYPEVKLISLLTFFPLILIYSKIVDYFSKEKIIYTFVIFFGLLGLSLVYFLLHPTIGLSNTSVGPHRILGWAFYVFVESYINLMVAIYWSFINDITTPQSAKKGYGLIVFGTQLGGVLFTFLGAYLSSDTASYSVRIPLIAFISIIMFFLMGIVVWVLKRIVTHKNLQGYKAKSTQDNLKKKLKVSFLSGIKLLISKPYVGGIFGLIFFYETIATIMSFQMYRLVKATFLNPGEVNKFIFNYALLIQCIAAIVALFGTSFFQRKLGVRFCLIIYPTILAIAIVFYFLNPSLDVVFYIMITIKAVNYSFNQPAKESLYIPTSKDIKYKSKAWIDVFGARFAKGFGSGINKIIGTYSGLIPPLLLIFVFIWISIADKIGEKYYKAISKNELID